LRVSDPAAGDGRPAAAGYASGVIGASRPGRQRRLAGIGVCRVSGAPLVRVRLAGSGVPVDPRQRLVLQLPFPQVSESMGNHDSKIVDAASVD